MMDGMDSSLSSTDSAPVPPNIDQLREEFSCAICLDLFFEPTTTSCGHSFCRKCLRAFIERFHKRCPICRQWMRRGGSCTVSTVMWNTIQLLFPHDVEAKKVTNALNSQQEPHDPTVERDNPSAQPNGNMEALGESRQVVTAADFNDLRAVITELRRDHDELRRDVNQQREILQQMLVRIPPPPPPSPS